MAKKKGATGRILHDPIKDKLVPIYPLDLSRIRTIDELVRAMGQTAFTARQIGDAAKWDHAGIIAARRSLYFLLC